MGEGEPQGWREGSLALWPWSPAVGFAFLRGKEVRERAMGGEAEFLLPWKHVREGTF